MAKRGKPKQDKRDLTPRERTFAIEYVKCRSYREAARRAGYSPSWCNQSSRIAKRPVVAAYIKERENALRIRMDRSAGDVVQELTDIAFQDPTSFLKNIAEEGEPPQMAWKSPMELTDAQKAAIKDIRVLPAKEGRPEQYRYTFHDKFGALVQMGRHYGLFEDTINITGEARRFKDLPQEVLLEMRDRMRQVMDQHSGGVTIEGRAEHAESTPDDRRLESRGEERH
jgi:phage terminase small subunit